MYRYLYQYQYQFQYIYISIYILIYIKIYIYWYIYIYIERDIYIYVCDCVCTCLTTCMHTRTNLWDETVLQCITILYSITFQRGLLRLLQPTLQEAGAERQLCQGDSKSLRVCLRRVNHGCPRSHWQGSLKAYTHMNHEWYTVYSNMIWVM